MPKLGEKLTLQQKIDRWNKLSDEYKEIMTKNLQLGTHIRNLCALDSMAQRYMPKEKAEHIRILVDQEMHQLGYESITERNDRWRKHLYDQDPKTVSKSWYRFRKLYDIQNSGQN